MDENMMTINIESTVCCPICGRSIGSRFAHSKRIAYIGVPCYCGYFSAEMQEAGEMFKQSPHLSVDDKNKMTPTRRQRG